MDCRTVDVWVFAAERYWPDPAERERVSRQLCEDVRSLAANEGLALRCTTITDDPGPLPAPPADPTGPGILLPMSGGVQESMRRVAERYTCVAIGATHLARTLPDESRTMLLGRNAAPAALEVYSVLGASGPVTILFRQPEELVSMLRASRGVSALRSSRILLVGGVEPWVLSASRNTDDLKHRLGMTVERVPLTDLSALIDTVSENDVHDEASRWLSSATAVREPDADDVHAASRIRCALRILMEQHGADGVAIACFAMLSQLGTTSCLAVSAVNDTPGMIAACEGDLDAAATMALMKGMTGQPAWMGNPVVGEGDTLTLVHCTAPTCFAGQRRPYTLHSHHESGIGVSPRVELPSSGPVTLCRIGRNGTTMSVHVGEAAGCPSYATCRTQLAIRLSSVNTLLDHSLGNHQILSFGDYEREARMAGRILGLDVLPR